jgi:hypothetical protein
MPEQDHVTDEDLTKRHQLGKKARQKGCLTKCDCGRGRKPGNICCHLWQAGVKAKSETSLYSKHPDYGNGYTSSKTGYHADFDHQFAPFWHNAHHMIPNGSLNNSITAAGKNLANVIRIGLLKATYNLNDKVNMIILPMKMADADALGLPRHLIGDEGSGQKPEKYSHRKYSEDVEALLKDIMRDFKVLADEAVKAVAKKHKQPNPKLAKDKLEDLSRRLYKAITTVGLKAEGKSLSEKSAAIKKVAMGP